MQQIEDNGGELTEELSAQLDTIEAEFPVKIENCCKYVRNLDAEIAGLDLELKRLTDRKRVALNTMKAFKAYMKQSLEAMELTKLDVGTFTVSIQANGGNPAIEWTGHTCDIPDNIIKTTIELDKTKALEIYANADKLPDGLVIHPRGNSLRIK